MSVVKQDIVNAIMSATISPGDPRPPTVQMVDYGTPWPGVNTGIVQAASDLLNYQLMKADLNVPVSHGFPVTQQDVDNAFSALVHDFQVGGASDPITAANVAITNYRNWADALADGGNGLRLNNRLAQGVCSGWSAQDGLNYFAGMLQGWIQVDQRDGRNTNHVELDARVRQLTSFVASAPPAPSPISPEVQCAQKGGLWDPSSGICLTSLVNLHPGGAAAAPMSTGTKVAIGAGVVTGLGVLGVAWYAWSTGLTIHETLKKIF